MRKLIATLMLAVSLPACAQHHYYGHHHHGYNPGWWIAPAIIGGAVVYGATRPAPTYPAPNPTNSAPVVVPKYPGAYPETPGTVWQQDWRYDQFCNCYRQFLVQVQ